MQEIEILLRDTCCSVKLSDDFLGDTNINVSTNLSLNTSSNKDQKKLNSIVKLNESLNFIRSSIVELQHKLRIKEMFIKNLKQELKSKEFKHKKNSKIILNDELKKSNISLFVPRWIPDAVVNKCSLCTRNFGIFFRKHHCRKCGDIFCGNCCNKYDFFFPHYNEKVRICRECDRPNFN